MKKLLSLVCVLALALALCVPAFAEDATPGQVDFVKENPTDYESAKAMNTALTTQSYIGSDASAAMKAAIYAAGNRQFFTDIIYEGNYRTSVSVEHVADADLHVGVHYAGNNTLEFDFSFDGGAQSELGAYISFAAPKSWLPGNLTYEWVNDAGQTGYVEFVSEETGSCILQFYAPHFSKYTIRPVSAPAAPADSNSVLARTNSDLNMTAVVLAVLALVLTGTCAASLKKRALNK